MRKLSISAFAVVLVLTPMGVSEMDPGNWTVR